MKQKLQLTKKLFLTVVIIATATVSYGQIIMLQDFEETAAVVTYTSQDGRTDVSGSTVPNPAANGVNNDATTKVGEYINELNSSWHNVQVNTIDESSTTDGKYFYVDFYVADRTQGTYILKLYTGDGSAETGFIQAEFEYDVASMATWYTFEFDMTTHPDGHLINTIGLITDYRVWTGSGGGSGAPQANKPESTYYFDNFRQSATVLSTSKYEIVRLGTYPNPTNGIINISDLSDVNKINVHDLTGKTLKTFGAQSSIDISDLPAGVYILHADNGTTQKIVKK